MEIPTRVNCQVPIRVGSSEIAGRGVFALAEVKAGDFIFTISKPLVSVTGNSEPSVQTTCEHCFASRHKSGATTIPVKTIKMLVCAACKITFYCSKSCQIAAWTHHHKRECKALMDMKNWELGNIILTSGKSEAFRLLIRLLIMRGDGKILDSEWSDLFALHTNRSLIEEANKEVMEKEIVEIMVSMLAQLTETKVPTEQIKNLFYAITTNLMANIQMLIRGNGPKYDPITPFFLKTGATVDPFVSMINHRCNKNAAWDFEGPELRIRATRDISAGQEITISYTSDGGDYIGRQQSLKSSWHFKCNCELCQEGPVGPQGDLRARFLDLRQSAISVDNFDRYKSLIEDILKAGFTLDAWPMHFLHMSLWLCHMCTGNWDDALKTLLIVYFVIEPHTADFTEVEEELDTAHHLINLLDTRDFNGLDDKVVQAVIEQLRAKRLHDTQKFFGWDSQIAKFQRKEFQNHMVRHKSSVSSEDYTSSLKELLRWAGNPGIHKCNDTSKV